MLKVLELVACAFDPLDKFTHALLAESEVTASVIKAVLQHLQSYCAKA